MFSKETSLIFLQTQVFQRRGDCMTINNSKSKIEKNLEERCRKALEKSYGMQIPIPKYLPTKRYRFLNRKKFGFKNKLLDALKNSNSENPDIEIPQVAAKIENQKRLSSDEFLKVQETIWQEGPQIKYQNPDVNERELRSTSYSPNP